DASKEHYSLLHAREIAATKKGHVGTFHDRNDADPGIDNLIDFIFVSEDIRVPRYTVFSPRYEAAYLSDHSAVMARITL
ncbi:MAG: hypothetical protein LBK22_00470, partial [Tannerella sp.]|nr:hypothetical protein [Tannerella sp.]